MNFATQNTFDELSKNISHLLYERTEDDHDLINKALDELNDLNYRYPIITNSTKAVLLVNNCCTLVPPDDHQLVPKCCKLISNLITSQKILIEGRTLTVCVEWILQTLKQCPENVIVDSLIALNLILRSHVESLVKLVPLVLSNNSPLTNLIKKDNSPEIALYKLYSMKCLESCTEISDAKLNINSIPQIQFCIKVFLSYLISDKIKEVDNVLYCKVLISCINGLRNIILQNQNYLEQELGLLLGITKSYMVYGIKDVQFFKPIKLMPTSLSIPEPQISATSEKKGGKIARQRKQRISNVHKNRKINTSSELYGDGQFCNHYSSINSDKMTESDLTSGNGSKLKTSDSDFSDTEAGKLAKLCVHEGRLRQAALSLFFNLVKLTDKKTIFSYWSNFIPDGTPSLGSHSLTTCVLKDPSPKGRMAALNVLLTLLTSSKLYLSQAEYSEKATAFTPFSITLGYMIKELHRCLSLALNENYIPVLIQVLKCFAGLIQATPYHRLSKGLITKIVRNVKIFVFHRDPTVQVAALIVIGCILTVEPVLTETKNVFVKKISNPQTENDGNACNTSMDEVEYVDFSSDDESNNVNENSCDMPWILEKCLQNLGKDLSENQENMAVTPVKTESLQILCAMSRNYVTILMAKYLNDIAKVLNRSLVDTTTVLYAGKTIDFIGQAMNTYFTNNTDVIKLITLEQGITFWQLLINGPLITLLQNEKDASFRAVGCDCFGSIGEYVFEHLPRDKQILIVTLLFACSRDDDNHVTGAAVRALGICVLFPSLREDLGFVVDVAESIFRTIDDQNLSIRIKTSWSLGNLSSALALNIGSSDVVEEMPEGLLLRLLQASIVLGSDNDRVKSNAVRAIGNLLQLVTETHLQHKEFKSTIDKAINVLIKNSFDGSHVKVKWNSCYALGSILKNDALFHENNSLQEIVYNALMELVTKPRNFKVRINAALALASPKSKKIYGNFYYPVWKSLLKALEKSQNMEDLSEYKHRDNLVEQICLSLGHLTTFLTLKDLVILQDNFNFYQDLWKVHTHRVLERLLPEKTNNLFLAIEHILSLIPASSEQQEVLTLILNVFQNNL